MIKNLGVHVRNWEAHLKLLASGAVAGAATGVITVADKLGIDAVKLADYTAQDWHRFKKAAAFGALLGMYYRARSSPYPTPPVPPPGGGQL